MLLIKSTIFNSSSVDGSAIFLVHLGQATDRKAVASLLSYFKTLCNGPVQEIEPTTSRSLVSVHLAEPVPLPYNVTLTF